MSEPWQHPRLVTSLTEDFLRARPKRRKPVKKAAAPSRKAPVAPKQRAKSARKIKTALQMEPLEGRVVLNAAPTLESLPNVTLNAGAPLMIPLNGFDNDGDGLTFTVQSSNSAVTGSMMNGRGLRMSVAGYGDMVFQLFEELAPRTTGRIIELAQSGFYNGIIFHRVIDGFVLQAGDPTGTGSGGSQLGDFDDEFHPDLQHTVRGILSMAKSQDDTNDSQFFITEVATRHLDFNHSIFGLLTEGEAVREAISGVDTNSQDKPLTPVTITSATVFNDGQNRALMLKAPIGTTGTSTITVTASDGKGGTVERSFQVTVQADATNNNPFLLPIAAPVSVEGDQPTVITLKAQDVEGNQVFFTVPANSNLDVTLGATQVNPVNQIAETTLTIKRKAGFLGNTTLTVIAHPTANSANTQSTSDRQALEINVTPATPSLALSAGSDTGPSVNDGVTQKNNTTTGPLTFSVTGLEAGAVVKLFSGSTLIGQGTSNGTSISVTTDGTTPLPDGPYSITATQTVGTTASKPSNAVAIVIDSKQPQFTTSPTTSVFALAPYDYNVNNDEEGTNGFAYGLVTGPAGMTINAQTGIISWTPTVAQVGVHQVVVRGRDLAGNYVDQVYDVTVNASAPTLNPIGAKSVDEEAPLNFAVTSSDPNGASETLTYSFVSGAPAGATLDPATGAFSFTPSELDGGANFSVTIRVTDSTGQFDEETIQLTVNEVNQAPVLAAIPDKAVVRDQLLTFTASATDGDRPAQTLTYSLLPGAPAGASINATTGVFTWTPTAAQSQATYTITVRVADGFTEVTDEFSVFVQDVAAAPEFPAVTNQVVDEGTTFTLNLAATDANLPNDRLTYSIQNGPAGATINAQGLLTWATTEADGPGTHSFTVLVTDALGLADTVTFSVTVNEVNQPPALAPIGDQTVDEGELLTFTAAGVDADLPANTLTYSLAAGAPAGATINPNTGLFQWQTTEADGGQSYTITVQVSDGTATTSETITVTVAEVNQNPVLEAIEDRTVDEGGVVEFTLTASDADLPANTLTYSVASNVTDIVCVGMNCGSSSGSKQALDFTFDPQSGLFRWVTTEAHGPGKYVFQATVSDGQGGSDTKTFYITVNEVNNAPVITEIDDVSVAEKTLLSFTPTVADVDLPAQTLTYSLGAGAPAGATINAATGLFQWTPTEAQGPGTYSISITVTDSGGLSDTETFSVTVTEVNDAPVIEEIADKSVNLNTTLTINVVASDPDVPAGGPLEYSLGTGAPAGMAIDAATGKLTWTPTAAQTGQSFDVRVIVKDSTGLTDEETFRATVNAAPVLDEILDQSIFEETLLAITAKANDTDAITYSLAAGAPAGMTIDPTTGAIRWTPTEAEGPGEFEITVVATDTGGLSTSVSFNVIVGEANTAPVLLPVEDQSGNAGEELTFTVSAQDKDLPGNTLRFSLEPGAPEGATIDPVTGVFRWTVPTDFSESSVEIVIRVTDDGPGALSTTITVQIALTDTALVLFTNNGSNALGTASSNSLLRSRNVSAVVVQQSVARSAAATAIENFDLPMSEADLAYMAGRIFRFGPEDGGVGPVARVDAAEAERRRREQEGETPTEQRSLKPPVDGENSTPTSGRANPSNSRPVTRTKLESRQQASLQPPAAQPVMDELFQEWETPAVDERAVESDEAAMIDFEAAWIDDATAEAFAEEQTQREDAKPQEASLGMLAIPLVVGELLARERRKKNEQQASRKPR